MTQKWLKLQPVHAIFVFGRAFKNLMVLVCFEKAIEEAVIVSMDEQTKETAPCMETQIT